MMNKKTLSLALATGIGVTVAILYYSPATEKIPPPVVSMGPNTEHTEPAPAVVSQVNVAPTNKLNAEDNDRRSTDSISESEKQRLLAHPKVQAYLASEQNKVILKEYFDKDGDGGGHDAEAIWSLIEDIEAQGRVVAFEALAMKLAWLEKNSAGKDDYEARSKALIAQYQHKAQDSAEKYRPENIPGFSEYKAEEARIIREANAMQVYPEGVSKQEYLRQRLLEARIAAYGS